MDSYRAGCGYGVVHVLASAVILEQAVTGAQIVSRYPTGVVFWWRLSVLLILAFVIWNLISLPLLPLYGELVVPAAQGLLNLIGPHGARFAFSDVFPTIAWQSTHQSQIFEHALSFRLLAYNLILYLTALTILPRASVRQKVGLAISGLPYLFLFHVFDLTMWAESRLLSEIAAQHYDWKQFDLWFAFVKFYNHFSILSLKQVAPLLLLGLQWSLLQQVRPGKDG